MKHVTIAASLVITTLMPGVALAQDRIGLTLAAGVIANASPPPAEDFSEPVYLFSIQRVMKEHFVLDGELNYWAHTSRVDRGPHDVYGSSGVIGHAEHTTEISDNTYWNLGLNFLVKSTGAVRVFGGVGAGIIMQDETYSQQEFGCSASLLPCNKYVNQYNRGPMPLFRALVGVEVPVTSLVAIVGSARYEDSSWESTSRNMSAIAGVRFFLK
jgi:hypothetical protein